MQRNRILGMVLMGVCIVGGVVALVGIGGVWWAQAWLTSQVNRTVTLFDGNLITIDARLGDAQDVTGTLRARVASIESTLQAAANQSELDTAISERVNATLDAEVRPQYNALRDTYGDVREVVGTALGVYEGSRRLLFFAPVPDLPTERLREIDRTLVALDDRLTVLNDTLATPGAIPVGGLVGELASISAQANERVSALDAQVQGYRQQVSEVREQVAGVQAQANTTLVLVALLLTLLLLWVAVLHAGMYLHALRLYRTGTLRPATPAAAPAPALGDAPDDAPDDPAR